MLAAATLGTCVALLSLRLVTSWASTRSCDEEKGILLRRRMGRFWAGLAHAAGPSC
jgi:hypothetical protein